MLLSDSTVTIVETTLRYGFPMLTLTMLNGMATWKLYELGIIRFRKSESKLESQNNISYRAESNERSKQPILITAEMRLFVSTVILVVEMTTMEVFAVTLISLDLRGVINYSINSIIRVYYYIIISVFGSLNPCLEIFTLSALRETMQKHCKAWISLCSKPKTSRTTETE
ncbi:unnamed protein product [Echinostoma caproni]|uniref:G_PROTEIN_RECEP_F1_2 domain-containing protein n=1 Tax=Echinostoma caproni TaxID=27848 RepID=A0A183AC32_9TREM|nr:unnamed protein product [Echinostoma caproni]